MKILITGANGFIGSYLAHYLLGQGHEVIASARQFHDATRKLLQGAHLLELDVLGKTDLQQLQVEADALVHTATANDIVSRDTLKGIELSAVGTKNMLDFAVQNKIPRCMVFSTLQVYGTELLGDISEQSPLHYQNDYGMNHLFGEMYAELYARTGKLQCVSVRPSNVYGRILTDSFNRWSLVPGCFCKEAFESGTITIKSSGLQLRNFVNLQNLSRAVEAILLHFPASYECYNLASSQGSTMLEVAQLVKEIGTQELQRSIELVVSGTEPAATNHFSISLEKLYALGFSEDAAYNLRSEITAIFHYLKSK
jgi:UDP-glucose 4-epimerase